MGVILSLPISAIPNPMKMNRAVYLALLFPIVVSGFAEGTNLLINGDFETNDLTGWSVVTTDKAKIQTDTAQASIDGPQGGTYFAKHTTDFTSYIYQAFTTVPGKTYDVSLWVARQNFGGNNYSYEVDVFDGGGDPGSDSGDLLSEDLADELVTLDPEWVQVSYQFVAVSTTSTYRGRDPGTVALGVAFDTVVIEEGTAVVTIDSFAITNATNGTDLEFRWDSAAGKVYDILSSTDLQGDPASWVVWQSNVPATVPQNIESYVRPGDPRTFFTLVEKDIPEAMVFSENFDGASPPASSTDFPTDWTAGTFEPDLGTTSWGVGNPNGGSATGPAAASSADYCVGTNILADYGNDTAQGNETDIWLRTPVLDLTAYASGTLSFKQFLDIEDVSGDLDYGSVRILDASDDFVLDSFVSRTIDGSSGNTWVDFSIELPAAAFTQPIKIEFRFEADFTNDLEDFAGWYIDDVEVSGGS